MKIGYRVGFLQPMAATPSSQVQFDPCPPFRLASTPFQEVHNGDPEFCSDTINDFYLGRGQRLADSARRDTHRRRKGLQLRHIFQELYSGSAASVLRR